MADQKMSEMYTYCSTKLDMQILPTPTILWRKSAGEKRRWACSYSQVDTPWYEEQRRELVSPVKGFFGDDGVQSTGETGRKRISHLFQCPRNLGIAYPVRTDPPAMRIGALTLGTSGTMATCNSIIGSATVPANPTRTDTRDSRRRASHR